MEECFLPLWWSWERTTLESNTEKTCLVWWAWGMKWENRTGEEKGHFLILFNIVVCQVFICQTVSGLSFTYSLWFEFFFLQPHEGFEPVGSSFPLHDFIAKDRAWPCLSILLLQPHSTTVCSMTGSGFCSSSAWSSTRRLRAIQKQHTTVVLCDLATSFLSPSLNLLSWTNSCLSIGFST